MSSVISLKNHLKVLEERHRELDKLIEEEFNHYDDDALVRQHKFDKLKLKQEIEQLKLDIITKEKQESGSQ